MRLFRPRHRDRVGVLEEPGLAGAMAAGGQGEEALDTLAQLLRVFGRESFRLDDDESDPLAERCERWARHLLTGTAAETQAQPEVEGERDWAGLKRFFTVRRSGEARFVERWRSESRRMIWDLVGAMRSLSGAGDAAQAEVADRLDRLETAAQGDSLAQLRAAVGETIEAIRTGMRAQRAELDAELAAMGRRLAAMREELSEARREMAIDGLTQVYNRRAFDEALEQNVTLSSLSGQTLVLLMVDIDHFKAVNDTRGHTAGDRVLRELAGRILRLFPRRRDFVARYGGEEFAIILPDADAETAPILAERLLAAVREQSFALEPPLSLTCSVGYAALDGREGATDLLARADQALYRAKHQGRDRAAGAEELGAGLERPKCTEAPRTAQWAT